MAGPNCDVASPMIGRSSWSDLARPGLSADSYLFASSQHEIGRVKLPRDLSVSAISSDFHDGILRNVPAAILWLTSVLSATLCLIRTAGQKQAALRTSDFDIDCGQFMV